MPTLARVTLFFLAPFSLLSSCDGWGPGCGQPPPEMSRESVEGAVFASETTVTYSDGVTPIGVFFDEEHRQAVTWDELPPPWVVAIVAAEDGRFWFHNGIDATSVARAARDNAEAGKVVSGGSTLTQQTAKNLFDRPDRSLSSKLSELDYALHLEKTYTKREILTFYANQFHVTGNGSGIGIAARYFFDKEPRDLTVLECAYLAGLVKGPANYDPFPGDAERQAAATERAVERTRYVLGRMVEESLSNLTPKDGDGRDITSEEVERIRAEAKKLLDTGFTLPFRKGRFRFDSSSLLDEIDRRLSTPAFEKILAEAGVKDPATAGLTVITTLDVVAQREATYALWHHLSDLGVMLEKRPASAFVVEGGLPPGPDLSHPPERHEFRSAQVKAHVDDHLEVDLGGFSCVLDRAAMVRGASAVHRGKVQDRYAKVPTADVDAFVAGIPDQSVVWVSVREAVEDGPSLCDLETRPELQGAVVVVQDGQLKAMVGGNTNKDFNRATAPRQMGSAFKPLIYHAAITLGWQPDEAIDNRRNIFPFSGSFWAPSPDHEPRDWVSMSWAGVNSENLASVWMLYHLTDRLTPVEVRELAEAVGLARGEEESEEDYRTRIQKAGVLPTPARVPESHFFTARSEVLGSLVAQGRDSEARELQSMYYGWGFSKERARAGSSDERRALDLNWLGLQARIAPCTAQYETLERAVSRGDAPSGVSDLSIRIDGDEVQVACGARPAGYVSPSEALRGGKVAPAEPEPSRSAPKPEPEEPRHRRGKSKGRPRPEPEPRPTHGDGGVRPGRLRLPEADEVLVDDRVTLGTLNAIASAMERQRLVAESQDIDLYDPEILYKHQDFRVLLGMRYVAFLAAKYGVKTKLAEVLSLPLGASEITLEETARLYEGLTSGQTWSTSPDGSDESSASPTVLISEIRDRSGAVLWKARTAPTRVVGAGIGQMTADILRNVVQYGTGKSAKEVAESGGAFLPLGGKTGTTNDFKNAAFAGYLPGPTAGGYSAADGPIVAVYVGYDDNRPMRAGKISVAGSVGALPAWIGTVRGIHEARPDAPSGQSPIDGYWPLARADGLILRPVRTEDGLPLGDGASSSATVLTRAARQPSERPVTSRDPEKPQKPSRGKKKPWWSIW